MLEYEEPELPKSPLARRFRGFLPVVVDVETAGFNAKTDALLEIAAVTLKMNDKGELSRADTYKYAVKPFKGANLEPAALEFTGIRPDDPFRRAIDEKVALTEMFRAIRGEVKSHGCSRAVMVAHNAHFDLGFINAAYERTQLKRNPFHPFSCMDTATLSGLAFGQTVLAKTCGLAGIEFDNKEAHSADYDAEKTADLFCLIVNKWQQLGGWPLADAGES